MVTGDAILGATALVGLATVTAGWRLAALLARIETRLNNQDEKIDATNRVVGSAAILNGKGDALVRDVGQIKETLRQHVATSDLTHASMWLAIRDDQSRRGLP